MVQYLFPFILSRNDAYPQYYNTSEGSPEIRPRGFCSPGNVNCFVVPYGFFSSDLSMFGRAPLPTSAFATRV